MLFSNNEHKVVARRRCVVASSGIGLSSVCVAMKINGCTCARPHIACHMHGVACISRTYKCIAACHINPMPQGHAAFHLFALFYICLVGSVCYKRRQANVNRKYACNVVGAAACGRLWYATITAIKIASLQIYSYVLLSWRYDEEVEWTGKGTRVSSAVIAKQLHTFVCIQLLATY